MESGNIGGFAPAWAVAPMKAQQYRLLDSPNERQNKMAQNAPSIPILKHPPMIQPASTVVEYAQQLGQQGRADTTNQIIANNQQHTQHDRSHYGRIHLIA